MQGVIVTPICPHALAHRPIVLAPDSELEVTVAQWVAFLNTVDPRGVNRHRLFSADESGAVWPRFGQIDFAAEAPAGRHYKVAAPEWANKPYGFANFLRAARFANSLANGRILKKTRSS